MKADRPPRERSVDANRPLRDNDEARPIAYLKVDRPGLL
jgi:hypothetical protein